MSNKPLFDGIKALAVARQIAAPFATYQLTMHGAEVLTLDNPKEVSRPTRRGRLDGQLCRPLHILLGKNLFILIV